MIGNSWTFWRIFEKKGQAQAYRGFLRSAFGVLFVLLTSIEKEINSDHINSNQRTEF